ncbi:hypothetical protein ANN_21834 [Periplaneta americana]|uniref:C2H2-type domain-containing protein n=1 Tax=Periplaneta americana TaxID=6978 RepID=A0ABQ8S6R0_PERAM|nr:hypothetical protein ANN_21834 [Periplaneta americana]
MADCTTLFQYALKLVTCCDSSFRKFPVDFLYRNPRTAVIIFGLISEQLEPFITTSPVCEADDNRTRLSWPEWYTMCYAYIMLHQFTTAYDFGNWVNDFDINGVTFKEETKETADEKIYQDSDSLTIKNELDAKPYFEHIDIKSVSYEFENEITFEEHKTCVAETDTVRPIKREEVDDQLVEESDLASGSVIVTSITDKLRDDFVLQDRVEEVNKSSRRSFACEVCNTLFSQSSALRRHALTHKGNLQNFEVTERTKSDSELHVCKICSESFTKIEALKNHSKIHNREHLHCCTVCKKSFTQLGTLDEHLRIHTGHKPHKCAVCEKSFTRLGELKRHLRVHTGERPYKCKECGKKFTELGSLKIHALMHNGERPFVCKLCNKTFTHHRALTQHALVHTDFRPHVCKMAEVYRFYFPVTDVCIYVCLPITSKQSAYSESHRSSGINDVTLQQNKEQNCWKDRWRLYKLLSVLH